MVGDLEHLSGQAQGGVAAGDGGYGDSQLHLRQEGADAVVRTMPPGQRFTGAGSAKDQVVGPIEDLRVAVRSTEGHPERAVSRNVYAVDSGDPVAATE